MKNWNFHANHTGKVGTDGYGHYMVQCTCNDAGTSYLDLTEPVKVRLFTVQVGSGIAAGTTVIGQLQAKDEKGSDYLIYKLEVLATAAGNYKNFDAWSSEFVVPANGRLSIVSVGAVSAYCFLAYELLTSSGQVSSVVYVDKPKQPCGIFDFLGGRCNV